MTHKDKQQQPGRADVVGARGKHNHIGAVAYVTVKMTHTFTERGGKGGRSWPQKCIDVNCGELVGQDVLTEFLSTFFLNLAIISLTVAFSAGTETVQAAFTIGFGVLVMVEGFGRFGETHINPAVSLAMMTLSRLSVWKGRIF